MTKKIISLYIVFQILFLLLISCSLETGSPSGFPEDEEISNPLKGIVWGTTAWNHNDYFDMGSGRYYLNNQWGMYDTNREKTGCWQKIVKKDNLYSVEYNLWVANGVNDIVLGYPSILNGWHYGQVNPGNGKCGFPVRIYENHKIMTSWSVSHQNWATWECYNTAYDIWIGQINTPWPSRPDTEVMIWLNRKNQAPLGSKFTTVYRWGTRWDVYQSYPGQTGNPGWTVYSFLRQSGTWRVKNVNISDFIYWLWKTKNLLDGRKYIVGVEAGNEIIQGKGKFTNNSFNLYVQ